MDSIESRLGLVSPGMIVLVSPVERVVEGSILGALQKVGVYASPVRASKSVYIESPAYTFVKRKVGPSGILQVPCLEKVETDLVCASRAQYAPVIRPLENVGDVFVGVEEIWQALVGDPFFRYMAPYFASFRS